jgi:hypothetical protein
MPKMIIIAGTNDLQDPSRRATTRSKSPESCNRKRATKNPAASHTSFSPNPCVDGRFGGSRALARRASLAAHIKHPNYLNMRDALGRIGLKGADNKKCRVDLSSLSTIRRSHRVPTFSLRGNRQTMKRVVVRHR